jgi:uncharacterized protein (DUF697 family)
MAQESQPATSHEKAEVPTATDATATGTPEMTPERRDEMAARLVNKWAVWSGAAGLIPVPAVDVLGVGGVQLHMLRRLSELYGVEFSENRGKALLASLAGASIPATSAYGIVSALKAFPIFGTLVGGFAMPLLSAGATYAIGKAFIKHFESGGTLLDFDVSHYREFIKSEKAKWGSRFKGSKSNSAPAVDSATRTPAASS